VVGERGQSKLPHYRNLGRADRSTSGLPIVTLAVGSESFLGHKIDSSNYFSLEGKFSRFTGFCTLHL
jgi:hypothetical protein